jgi:hypothetical protein
VILTSDLSTDFCVMESGQGQVRTELVLIRVAVLIFARLG